MPTDHRGQDIGAHNHANLITEKTFVYRDGGVEHTLSSPDSNQRYTAESGPSLPFGRSAFPRGFQALTGVHHPEGTELIPGISPAFAEYRFGMYGNAKRAEMASIAAANRYERTGSFGPSQRDIRMSRSYRKRGSNEGLF